MSKRPKTDECPVCGCKEDDGYTYLPEESDIDNDFPGEFKRCPHCASPFLKHGRDGCFAPYVEEGEIDVCFWTLDDESCFYDTSCGESFQFTSENKKAPGINGFLYCPYCGKKIIRIRNE